MFSTLANAVKTAVTSLTARKVLVTMAVAGMAIGWVTRKKKKKMNLPPHPPGLPVLGNAWELKGSTLTKKATEWNTKYGPTVLFYTGSTRWLILGNIEAMTEAYTQRDSDFATKPNLTSLNYVSRNGKDIAFAPYDKGLVYRRKLTMLAIRQFLADTQLTDRINDVVTEGVSNMLANNGEAFDPHDYLSHIIFNILHGICFGYTLRMDDPRYKDIMDAMDRLRGDIAGFWEDIFPLLRHAPTKSYREFMSAADSFRAYVTENIANRRDRLNGNQLLETVVDHVLKAQKDSENEQNGLLRGEFTDIHTTMVVMDVFFAGIDTMRTTMDWLFLTMTKHQNVQNRVHQEVVASVGDGIPNRDHRPSLVYTEAAIMEVMRCFPAVPVGLPHETMRDTKVGGYDIPAKTLVAVNQYAILHDERYWQSPATFMPERFIEADGSKLKPRPQSWIPFSIGPRNCIGESMAKMNLLYTVAGVFQKLHFSFPDDAGPPDFTPQDKWLANVCKPYKVIARRW